MPPILTALPCWMMGSRTQSVVVIGGSAHAVGAAPPGPVSVSLHSDQAWSNTQLCPPPVSGCAGSLCSLTELSGMNSDPTGSASTPGDQPAVNGFGVLPATKPPAGNVLPSEQTAQA